MTRTRPESDATTCSNISFLIFTTNLGERQRYPCFTDEETEAQRGERGEEDGGWRGRTCVHWGLVCTRHKLGASHTSTAPRRQSDMSHFTDREAEAQRGGAPSLRSHSLGLLNWVWNLGCLTPTSL